MSSDHETAEQLVQEGWSHLQLQRPLAAWASWRRALGYVPGFPTAQQALTSLEQSPQLPAAARTPLKFQSPGTPKRRKRWDSMFKDRDLEDLADAAEAFGQLASNDAEDDGAWYNYAVCLSWLGRNVEAVTTFERVVALRAEGQFERAVEGWTRAEILRQGGGAEQLADDLAYAWMLQCSDSDSERILSSWPGLLPVPTPLDPNTGEPQFPDATAYTWLDRPLPEGAAVRKVADLPRVLAQILKLPGVLRLSSPDPVALDRVFANLRMRFGDRVQPLRREATLLPLMLLDAGLWSFRLPPGLDHDVEADLARGAIEQAYENEWVHRARRGLGDRTPLETAEAALAGDVVARAKLAAVVLVREQLGARPWTAQLYHGYPFDRLRRRLGLALNDPASVDPHDASCMSRAELARLDPATLADVPRAAAYESATGLRNDELAAHFAAELARRNSETLARLDTPGVIATLVREAMKGNASDEALEWLDQARGINGGRDRRTFDVWAAEIHARTGAPSAALQTYQELLEEDPENTELALDAAETLLDNGFPEHARTLLDHALEQALRLGDQTTAARAQELLEQAASNGSS